MSAAWIRLALDRALPKLTGGERDRAAVEVADSIPPSVIKLAIFDSISTVLRQRGIRDEGGELARELANNSAQSVLFGLAGFDEDDSAAGCSCGARFATTDAVDEHECPLEAVG